MNLYKKITAKTYSFLVIDATIASDNSLCFRRNLIERIYELIMTIIDKFIDEKMQCHINTEAAEVSTSSFRTLINMNIL